MHYLSEFSPPGRVWAEFGSKILSSLSWPISSYLIPFWLKLTPGSFFFFNFLNFFAVFFFLQFSPPGRVWAEFGSKIILSLSRPILSYLVPFLLKITTESCFLIFLNFFAIFFRNFLPRVEYERNRGLKLFSLFLGLSHPNLAKNNAE